MSQYGRPRLSRARAKPVAAMAVLSTRNGEIARSLASESDWPFYEGRPAAVAVLIKADGRFIKAGQPQ